MEQLMALSAAKLRQRCRENSLSASGAKAHLAKRLLAKEKGYAGNWAAGTGFGGADSMGANDQSWRSKSETVVQQRAERTLGKRLHALRMGLPVGSFAPDIRPILRKSSIRAGTAALIRNTSLLDMTDCRREVFTEALELLAALANHAQGKDVLVEPLDSTETTQSLHTLLLEMQTQSKVFLGGFQASTHPPNHAGYGRRAQLQLPIRIWIRYYHLPLVTAALASKVGAKFIVHDKPYHVLAPTVPEAAAFCSGWCMRTAVRPFDHNCTPPAVIALRLRLHHCSMSPW